MYRVFKVMAVSLNALMVGFFAFFMFSLIEPGKAGNMAGAETLVAFQDINQEIETLQPKLIGNDEQAMCMALNIYYESRSDNLAGQYAVADVVLNRMHDDRYPNTVCEVITQGPTKESWKTKKDPELPDEDRVFNPIRHKCQFSWYCDGKSDDPKDETGWVQAQYVAGAILYSDKYRGITEGATHYHATYVKPRWANDRGMNHIGRIGAHVFYRWD
jgi:spore germination cell wall hydrolase CwlJ-like protein